MDDMLKSLYAEALTEEYGFSIEQLDELVEATKWVVEDLGLPENRDTAWALVHLAARAYVFGFDEGVEC